MNLRIIVATHKSYWMPDEKIYLPIQVGSYFNDIDLGFVKDSEGTNIADKNKNFCELTATYWAWKNLNATHSGLCHYRRYFSRKSSNSKNVEQLKELILSEQEITNILKNYDVILPEPISFKKNVSTFYKKYHHIEDLMLAGKIIHELYPEYDAAFNNHMNSNSTHMYNMLVTSKEVFDDYCSWLFTILFELEKRVDITQYDDYQKRIFGFISERLMDVYFKKNNHLKIHESPVVFLEPKPSFFDKNREKLLELLNI